MNFDTTQSYDYKGKYIGYFVEYIGFPLNGDWLQDARARFSYTNIQGETLETVIDRGKYDDIRVSSLETESPSNIYAKMPREIITEIASLAEFKTLLDANPGVFILKLGAEWCGPCKRIEPLVHDLIRQLPTDKIQCAIVDVDESFELYAFLKTKKMANGIPAILAYYAGNTHYIPDDVVIGADPDKIIELFNRAVKVCN
jgi:thiol-disulfide isomerase/thioredoxin